MRLGALRGRLSPLSLSEIAVESLRHPCLVAVACGG